MNKLPRLFSNKKQSKSMDQRRETPLPSPGPRLVRRNAIKKNVDYNPSSFLASSSSSSSSRTSTSSAPRTRSLDLYPSSDSSLRIRGNDGQLDRVWGSLGLSGPEDFEIPKAVWEVYRLSSDVIQQPKSSLWDDDKQEQPKSSLWDDDKQEQPQQLEVQVSVDGLPRGCPCGVQSKEVIELGDEVEQLYVSGRSSKAIGRGIKGDRPPVLTPPPATWLHVVDECSDQENEPAPEGDGGADLYPVRCSPAEKVGNHDELIGVGSVNTMPRSDTSSFTSHDDDSSSSSTDNSPIPRTKFNFTNWQKGGRLGQGSFGTVYEGISSDGMFFAIKEVSLLEQGGQARDSILSLQKEIEMLSQLQHENIVRYLGTQTDDANLYIFLELVTKGSLASLYSIYLLPESIVSAYTRQILSGLKYLHSKKIVHRDIKCANILVASTGTIKLADFGLAKAVKLNDLRSCKGTALWMAPEVVKNQGYGTAADIWSLGCTVLEMSTGQLPYHPLDSMQAIYRIGMGQPPPIPESLSADLRDFVLKCLQVNPRDRPSAAELLDHPFLNRRFSTSAESLASGRWPGT